MNILVIANNFPPEEGGIPQKISDLVNQWGKEGNSVIVLTPVRGPESNEYKRIHVPLKGHYLRKAYRLSREIRRIVRLYPIDVIYCLCWSPEGIAVLLSGLAKKIKWAVTVNGFDVIDGLRSHHTRFIMRQVFRQATKIYPPGNFLNSKVQTMGDFSGKTMFIPHGIDTQKFSPNVSGISIRKRYGLENYLVIMTLCRLHPIKAVDQVIDAFNLIVRRFKNTRLLIVGDGPQKNELRKKVAELHLDNKVIFTGYVPHQETPLYYAACDIFVQAGRLYKGFQEEGHPFNPLEASACRKPVVASAVGGIPEEVINNETGLLITLESLEELTQKLEYLLLHPEERKKLGANGVQFVREQRDIEQIARIVIKDLGEANHRGTT